MNEMLFSICFDEAVGVNGAMDFYFIVPKRFLEKFGLSYPDAECGELCLSFTKGNMVARLSPTKKIDGHMTDYDWNDIDISDEDADRIMGLAVA